MRRLNKHLCIVYFLQLEFKSKAHFAQHLVNAHGVAVRSGSPCPVMKTRAAFCLVTTPLTRISRQICKGILDIRRAARQPFTPINIANIKQECEGILICFLVCESETSNKTRVFDSTQKSSYTLFYFNGSLCMTKSSSALENDLVITQTLYKAVFYSAQRQCYKFPYFNHSH